MSNTNKIDLSKISKVYFIGIGGIGISGAARILDARGIEVVGSDAVESEITDQLKQEGIKVYIPQSADNVPADADLAVYTVAVPDDNPERKKIKELGIKEITYPQLLGELIKGYKAIGVSGTNGKTTTTAMISLIFMEAGFDPTVVLGAKANFLGGNSRLSSPSLPRRGLGSGLPSDKVDNYFIFESDEYRRAFDYYQPQMAVITYIAEDHLDYYKDIDEIKSAFSKYLNKVSTDGVVFINADDPASVEVAENVSARKITFGIESSAEIEAKNIQVETGRQKFDLFYKKEKLGEVILNLPARYNVYNVLAAVGPALMAGIDFKIIANAVSKFKGTWRRFEKLGQVGRTIIMTDYAHTPDALEQTITATKQFFPDKKILFVFQPHQYNRTKNFFDQFAQSFNEADEAMIMDIFYVKGRENPKDFDVDAKLLVQAAQKNGAEVEYITENGLKEIVKHNQFDLIMMMGAGDIYGSAKRLLEVVPDPEQDFEDEYEENSDGREKIKGAGFSRQKEVIEKNKFYQGDKKNKINIKDKTKK